MNEIIFFIFELGFSFFFKYYNNLIFEKKSLNNNL